jgi:hypothetical protein
MLKCTLDLAIIQHYFQLDAIRDYVLLISLSVLKRLFFYYHFCFRKLCFH